jgi:hypothetical protein
MDKNAVAIASPCTADWRTMTPADGGRFCGDCKKVVRDLSKMRERDARTLLKSADNGELCVRYLYDKHGKVFFAGDSAPPLVPASFLQRAKRIALSAAAVAVPLSLQACSPGSVFGADEPELHESMGGVGIDKSYYPEPDAEPDAAKADAGDGGDRSDAGDGGDAAPETDGGIEPTPDAETPI